MRILSAAEMQACDAVTTGRFGVPSIDLMRAAAAAVAEVARRQFPRARRVTVLCGCGNNGGDGMMAARLLAREGLRVTVLLFGDPGALKGDAAVAWHELTHQAALCRSCHPLRAPTHPASGRSRRRSVRRCAGWNRL